MFILYDFIFIVFIILWLPHILIKKKISHGFFMRFGFFKKETRQALGQANNIWVHAVSVGEVLSVLKLIEQLKNTFPFHNFVVSTVTKTGYEMAQNRLSGKATVVYAPMDFSLSVRRYIDLIRPKIYIAAETEIWPNLFYALRRRQIPIVQINGRISDRGFWWYRWVRFLLKPVLLCVNAFCMQTPTDAERIIMLGAPQHRVEIIGNIKFDDLPAGAAAERQAFGLGKNEIIWVAGSTHAGEEEFLIDVFKETKTQAKDLRLIIAPRHIERTEEISKLITQRGFSFVLFSKMKDQKGAEGAVILVDTMGDLKSLYSVADIVFVGRSLVTGGGHNIIEPAFFGRAILVGSHMENFRDILDCFAQEDAVIQLQDKGELEQRIFELIANPQKREKMGASAKAVVAKYTGATRRTAQTIAKILSNV